MHKCQSQDQVQGTELVRHLGSKYILMKEIGKGGFSVVRLAVDRQTKKQYACKMVDIKKMNEDESKSKRAKGTWKENLCLEIAVMKVIKHDNIVAVEEVMITEKFIYIILELPVPGTLFDKMQTYKNSCLPNAEGCRYAAQIILGLKCIHDFGIAHRDLKPDNILLDERGVIKLTDFGLCKLHLHSKGRASSDELDGNVVGTPQYIAPECLAGKPHDAFVSDLWSLGVVIYVMLAGKFPFFAGKDEKKLRELIMAGVIHNFATCIVRPAADIIKRLVCADVAKRATLTQAWRCQWLAPAVGELAIDLHKSRTAKPKVMFADQHHRTAYGPQHPSGIPGRPPRSVPAKVVMANRR
eukprot:TRINITY_DN19401_c0_g1_i1.p1 TRINITY_DN19401_c0_g1~~TRINITY_DN19401_c0_g1_i1.p1  ORF type:complete len:354 (+),score=50.08 TRINITY_DN19401_c0_g1_i1:57-1118(+)